MSESATATALLLAAVIPALSLLLALNTTGITLQGGFRWRTARPWPSVAIAFGAGVACAWPAYHLERCLVEAPWAASNLGAVFLFWLIVAGAVEEGCKFAAFHLGTARTRIAWDEYDGILYAGAVALGFACIENVLYVSEAGWQVARVRAVTAVPAHAMFGVIMGAGLGLARARARVGWSTMGLPLTALALAVLAHGVYDVLASLQGPWAMAGVCGFLAMLAAFTLRLCWKARTRATSLTGRRTFLPPPHGALRLPPMPHPRNPWVAGVLGLIPGLGQAYNGELAKSALFLAVGLVNLGLYWLAHLFVNNPERALKLMQMAGVMMAVNADELARAVEQKWLLLPTMAGLVLMWEAVGAVDAFTVARQRWRDQQVHAVRRSFAPHGFGASYVVHVFIVFLLVVAPIVEAASSVRAADRAAAEPAREATRESQDEKKDEGRDPARAGRDAAAREWKLTWVTAPIRIEGWQETPEGRPEKTPSTAAAPRSAAPPYPTREGWMPRPGPRPRDRRPNGQPGSYNQYISFQIRRHGVDMHFFRHVRPTTWAVVHYRIAGDGRLLEATLVKFGGGSKEDAVRAVDVIRRAAPYEPLPQKARELDVTELFWAQGGAHLTPGTLEWRLSQLPDGRQVKATK